MNLSPITKQTLIKMRQGLRDDKLCAIHGGVCQYFHNDRSCIVGHVLPEQVKQHILAHSLNTATDYGMLVDHLDEHTHYDLHRMLGISFSQGMMLQAWHDHIYTHQIPIHTISEFDAELSRLIEEGGELSDPDPRSTNQPVIFNIQ